MPDALALTLELIRCPSVTPADAGCQALIASRLERAGFLVERLKYGEVENLWATRGPVGAPTLCLAGHTDVVPPGPAEHWHTDPWCPTIRDGVLYGRGAADMKSGLAAMVTAAEVFTAARPRHSRRIAFLITSDEEGRAIDGTQRVVATLKARGERIDWCLLGEPSSELTFGDTIKIGRRGSLSGELTVHGIQGHIAYPQLADNPVHRFAPALAELCARSWDQGNEHFEPTRFQIANIHAASGAPNVIPGVLKTRFNLRWSPTQTLEGLKSTVTEVLDRHGLKFSLEWIVAGLPFYTPPGALVRAVGAALTAVAGVSPRLSTGGGTSDGRYIAALGSEIVELGVVNRTIHQVNENVRVGDIAILRDCYARILETLCA